MSTSYMVIGEARTEGNSSLTQKRLAIGCKRLGRRTETKLPRAASLSVAAGSAPH